MDNGSCDHIYSYKCAEGLNSYEVLHAFYVSCIAKDSRRRKALDCLCMTVSCQTRYQRIHACLSCVYFGCYNGGHIHEHAKEEGHALAIDTNFGYVYCFECGDYQYDVDFDRIAQKQKLSATHKKGEVVNEGLNFKWEPSAKEAELLRKHVIINIDYIKGLRGIKNLGNTCYMSVIILSLVHAPVFRDYFLSLKHKCNIQNIPSESQVQVSDQVSALERSKPVCFVCEMSEIIQEFFCGELEPFIPDRLLYLVWLHADDFKNTGQHDAHEFFLKLLDFLHLHYQGLNENISCNDHSCNCIIDTIFTGSLREEYTFQDCKHTLINVDGYKGIFLELQSHKSSTNNDTDGVASETQRSLSDFLRGTQSEVAKKTCASCNEVKEYHKRMTLNKLPIILTFYLQQNAKESEKLFVSFPEFLDMTPFMTPPSKEKDKPENGFNTVPNNMFYLFAVVVHTVSKDQSGGHYTSYVRRHKTEWFHMDDEHVKRVSLEEVLDTKAFLLFYHKEILEYEDRQRVCS